MKTHTPSPGTTTIELIVALALVAVLATLALPALHGAVDAYAARAARDGAAAAFVRARALAVSRGSATVTLDLASGSLSIEAPVGTAAGDGVRLGDDFGVTISVDGRTASSLTLRWDALGLGRIANRTLRFRRGGAETRLTLSSFGRPRRW